MSSLLFSFFVTISTRCLQQGLKEMWVQIPLCIMWFISLGCHLIYKMESILGPTYGVHEKQILVYSHCAVCQPVTV